MAADCVRSQGGSSRVKARYSCRNKRERAPPLDAPKLTIFSFLHTRHLFFLLFDTALSPFRLRSAPFRSVPSPFRSVPSPFRYAMAARVLRSVPRARRHYTRARARCAAPFAPLHSARRAGACGGTTLARALVAPPPVPALPRLAFRSASAQALHSLRSLRLRPRSTPRQAGSAATAAPPAQTAPLRSADCAGGAASLHSTPPTLRSTTLHYAPLRPRRPLRA